MSEIERGGVPPITPGEQKMYEQEYRDGAQLFQKALDQYRISDSIFQKHEFQEVMEKAMTILNQTARQLKQESLTDQNSKIATDYQTFIQDPSSALGADQLRKDLMQAQKKV
ncbi:MAG: hypothetical protein KGI80_03240 [Verrucomicrobiota bacterium]|nr:hypothetical protein [Verrucomicrobiota bacterium]